MTALPQNHLWALPSTAALGRRWLETAWPMCVLAPLFALLAWRSWGTWPDPMIDFGRELFVPWRMAEGDVLYRDVAYFNGPLSPAFNALCFSWFGASLQTLVVVNLAIAAATTGALFMLLRQVASRQAATIGCTAFLTLCVFSQFTHIRNYNFICPYSHEMTHGLLLALLALAAAWQVNRRGLLAAAIAGALLGLALLTKVEIALAATVAVLASIVASLKYGEASQSRQATDRNETLPHKRSLAAHLIVAMAVTVVPPLLAVVILSRSMPVGEALDSCLAAWNMAANAEIREIEFYRRGIGTFNLGESLALLATSAARWMLLLAAAYILMRLNQQQSPIRRRIIALAVGGVLAGWLYARGFNWPLMERAFPIALLALVVWNAWEASRKSSSATNRRAYALRALWCLFALVLLAKIALNSRISHYGFVLAVPALTATVAALFDWLPALARRRSLPGEVFSLFVAPFVIAYVLAYQSQQSLLLDRSTPLGDGPDRFAAAASAAPVAVAHSEVLRTVRPDQALAVLPEGVMLNYLTRRTAPTKYITWMPPELYHFGEAEMLAALQQSPPDYIVIAPRDLAEYGLPPFGAGYADSIARWCDAHYVPVAQWPGDAAGSSTGPWRMLKRAVAAPQTAKLP